MKNKKILKSIIAFIFVFGLILSNLSSVFVKAAEDVKTNVVIHKMELSELDPQDWPKKPGADGTIPEFGGIYDGNRIDEIENYFGAGAKELAGVEFTYWKVTKEQYEDMIKTLDAKDTDKDLTTVTGVENYFDNAGSSLGARAGDSKGTKKSGKTTANGLEIAELEDGYYWFVENLGSRIENLGSEREDEVKPEGKTISKAAAVPFGLELPVYKKDGSRFNTTDKLHVYPKNTLANKPKIDKNFSDKNLDVNDPDRKKDVKNVFLGETVEYKILTEIPKGAEYKTLSWSDSMTEGLKYKQDTKLSITLDGKAIAEDKYELEVENNGFHLKLKEEGLKEVREASANKVSNIEIKYSAEVTEEAIVDRLEVNDVTLNYGNNPSTVKDTNPKPNKPNEDGNISVEKRWNGTDEPADYSIRVNLYDAHTGELVPGAGEGILTKLNKTHQWTGLDKNKQYKVVEKYSKGYTPSYTVADNGATIITNHKDDNPEPISPSEPKVVTGGKRFQKVDKAAVVNNKLDTDAIEGKEVGLSGAEFYIKNEAGEYLAKKDVGKKELDQTAYVEAEKEYKAAVKENNGEIARLKEARDIAYRAVKTEWKWINEAEKENNAFVVTSGKDGYFKVTGLAYGTYYLEEKTAPEGYAKIPDPVEFVVDENSNEETTVENISAHKHLTDTGLVLVGNKKITIPQTGGMGTVIFTVVGALVMGSAVVAMRRRKTEEE